MDALLQRRNDQRRARHHPFQHRMRRAPLRQRRSRNRRKPDRLADEPPPGLFKHQGKLGEAETEAVRGTRDEDAEPPEFARLAQPCRREARLLLAKSARHLRPRRRDEFGGAVAQQSLLRCQMQVHERMAVRQFGRFSTRRARTLRWISDEPP